MKLEAEEMKQTKPHETDTDLRLRCSILVGSVTEF